MPAASVERPVTGVRWDGRASDGRSAVPGRRVARRTRTGIGAGAGRGAATAAAATAAGNDDGDQHVVSVRVFGPAAKLFPGLGPFRGPG